MTTIICDMTGCKYNSSCCLAPKDDSLCICTKENITLKIDEEISQLDCAMFEENDSKEIECTSCQVDKYGGIKLPQIIKFTEA